MMQSGAGSERHRPPGVLPDVIMLPPERHRGPGQLEALHGRVVGCSVGHRLTDGTREYRTRWMRVTRSTSWLIQGVCLHTGRQTGIVCDYIHTVMPAGWAERWGFAPGTSGG